MSTDVRWQQRFVNFEKSLLHLQDGLAIEQPDLVQSAGIIQFFEISFELAWKVLKDFLEAQGFNDVKSPRSAIKKAFEIQLISNGDLWLKALQDRNLSTHLYDEDMSNEVISSIRSAYVGLLVTLHKKLQDEAK